MNMSPVERRGPRTRITSFLDSFIAERGCVPEAAQPILSVLRLPETLQRLAVRVTESEGWRAWMSEAGAIWFVRGKISNTFTRRLSRPAMHVFFHDVAGEITESGTFMQDAAGRWDPCEMPNARPGRDPGVTPVYRRGR